MHDILLPEDVSAMFSEHHHCRTVGLMHLYLPLPETIRMQYKDFMHPSGIQ